MGNGSDTQSVECWVYRSTRHEEMYLYMNRPDGLESLPEPLLRAMGRAELVMTLTLTPDRALARCDVSEVIASLHGCGYHLQMPPTVNPVLRQGD